MNGRLPGQKDKVNRLRGMFLGKEKREGYGTRGKVTIKREDYWKRGPLFQ